MKLSIELKKKLFSYCEDYVNRSIKTLENALADVQDAANSDTKGSAGDKHETGRAMMHLESEKNAKQLSERLSLKKVLALIDPKKIDDKVQLGSLVISDSAKYYISIPIGKVSIEGEDYFVISPVSPIGNLLIDKQKGEGFSFNSKTHQIVDIY